MKTLILILLWGGIAFVSSRFFSIRTEVDPPESLAGLPLPKSTGEQVTKQITFNDIIDEKSEANRWRMLEDRVHEMSSHELARWCHRASDSGGDHWLNQMIREAVMEQWVQVDPEAVMEEIKALAETVPMKSILRSWFKHGDRETLWAGIREVETPLRRKLLEKMFVEHWQEFHVEEPDALLELTEWPREDFAKFLVNSALEVSDLEALTSLKIEFPNQVSGWHFFKAINQIDFEENPTMVFSLGAQFAKDDQIFYETASRNWPSGSDPTPMLEWAFQQDDQMRDAVLEKLYMTKAMAEPLVAVLRESFEDESVLSQSLQMKLLTALTLSHHTEVIGLLPTLDPNQRGAMIAHLGATWNEHDLKGALDWSETLTHGRTRAYFLQNLFSSSLFEDRNYFTEWFIQQSEADIVKSGAVKQVERIWRYYPDEVDSMIDHLPAKDKQRLLESLGLPGDE